MDLYATFNFEAFPVVVVAFTGHKATEENFQKYLDDLYEAYDKALPFAYLFDAERAAMPGLRYQKMQADWLKANDGLMKKYCQGTAYHIPNAIIRTALKGIFALQQQPVPYKVAGDFESAMEWCRGIARPQP
ncbi:MAG: hypothetical protein RIC19_17720 [Phaeodactylibacter sp.]|uniref:STAS/SEC14 domain-containing protein n=1 Tax=Phaeodactylibacter sp. TaxID=1940289 RepID=UPI0032F0526A